MLWVSPCGNYQSKWTRVDGSGAEGVSGSSKKSPDSALLENPKYQAMKNAITKNLIDSQQMDLFDVARSRLSQGAVKKAHEGQPMAVAETVYSNPSTREVQATTMNSFAFKAVQQRPHVETFDPMSGRS